jgi:hypothetical protein
MSEIQNSVVESAEETVLEVPTLPEIVAELVGTEQKEFTAYSVATFVNKTFEVLGNEKRVPPQMMYNYTRNGLVAKGKKGKATDIRYSNDEVQAFVNKYVGKQINK